MRGSLQVRGRVQPCSDAEGVGLERRADIYWSVGTLKHTLRDDCVAAA